MHKRLALSLLFASVLARAMASGESATQTPMLSQESVGDPDAVVAWLKENGSKADKATARHAFERGLQRKARQDWGAAAKAFGDSTAFYPTPGALVQYAEANLRMLNQLKSRNTPSLQDQRRHLASAESTYRAALAADTVLHSMTIEERRTTRQHAACLAEYLSSGTQTRDCLPLQLYGVVK